MGCWAEKFVLVAHTHTHNHFMALWDLSRTTRVRWYQKKHSSTHNYRCHQSSNICFFHLIRSMASSLFSPRIWQSFSTIFLQVFFGLPLGLALSTSYTIHFFTQSLSFFIALAHTITAACFSVVLRLCHLILVSLSTLYLEFYLVASCHTSI